MILEKATATVSIHGERSNVTVCVMALRYVTVSVIDVSRAKDEYLGYSNECVQLGYA